MLKNSVLACGLLLCSLFAQATTHIINFGGAAGLTYAPSTLNVVVGDVIQWQGSFGSHPLQSTSVPAGAAAFSSTTGTTFSYAVTVAGNYAYRCTFHAGAGMTGAFTASPATATETGSSEAKVQVSVLNGGGSLLVQSAPTTEATDLQICNLAGQVVFATVLENGSTDTRIDLQNLPHGAYIVTVFTRQKTYLLSRKFLKG
jgi:plastocyanin